MSDPARPQSLAPLVGDWVVQILRPETSPDPIEARQRFSWVAGGAFLLQEATVDHPDFPCSVAIMSSDTYHYFDSRGVARKYEMSLKDGLWMISGKTPEFGQRFSGRFSADQGTIQGQWEMSRDGGARWKHDFGMTYTRVA